MCVKYVCVCVYVKYVCVCVKYVCVCVCDVGAEFFSSTYIRARECRSIHHVGLYVNLQFGESWLPGMLQYCLKCRKARVIATLEGRAGCMQHGDEDNVYSKLSHPSGF